MIEPATPEMRRVYAARWKFVGIALLVLALVYAPARYVMQMQHPEDNLSELIPDYDKTMQREVAVQMGPMGLVFMQWTDALKRPGVQAFLILAGAALLARGCYYIAARLREDP
jgi:hypothetical protein